ncbi:MAG: hypothetical protein C4576_24155 [Desulfobacteraceae bacterium]|nr:MAG: hypothetical protein C4576_24155 [Desulfobacteraceae bacterium]
MKWIQWIPMIATLVVIYLLRWSHIGVTNFKVFVLIFLVWTLLLIVFYSRTREVQSRSEPQREERVGR